MLKSKVYKHKPTNIFDLQRAIRLEILSITQEQLYMAVGNFTERILALIEPDGLHIEQLN